MQFFFGNSMLLPRNQAVRFKTIYPLFHQIAVDCQASIIGVLESPTSPMDDSVMKVIDNAIVGFCLRELGAQPEL
jgi:hypothetical protein